MSGCCPREGYGLHLVVAHVLARQPHVVVPVRGTGCINQISVQIQKKELLLSP